MVGIANYFATVSAQVDDKSLRDVDKFLAKIENRLSKTTGKKGLQVNLFVDEGKFHKHLQGVLNRAGKSSPFKLSNVTIDPAKLVTSIQSVFSKAQFKAPISATISRASLQTIRSQVQAALQGVTIGVRTGSVASRGVSGGGGSGTEAQRRRASLTGRGDPSLQEFLMGKPDKSSLSAGNRRYLDAIIGTSFGGVGGGSLSGMAVQGGLGGLARVGGGSLLGRAAGMLGMATGGPFGAAMGMVGSGIVSLASSAFTGIWSTLGKAITLPFQAVSGAASMVTGAFYRLALAAVPLVAGFNLVNKNVQQQKSRQVAMNTISKSFGSTGAAESKWLMDMSNREGMRYDTLVDPFTSFIASSAPSMGLKGAKDIFQAFTQFGLTRGADDESMKRAMVAVSQMSGKGKVGAEELRQQLGDARGFGEMQSIFAKAYQMSLGRTGDMIKEGQPAIEELGDAMKKGNVYSSKVLPYVAEIAKQMAEPGLAEARGASFAQQNRFMNQLTTGWMNFSSGGGESGIAFFWQMMQRIGSWWIENGSAIGQAFETSMYWLDAFRLGVYEFISFAKSGESNSFVQWASSWGINLTALRDEVVKIFTELGRIFGVGEGMDLKTKIQNFSLRLKDILASVGEMLGHIATFLSVANKLSERNWYESFAMFNPFSDVSKETRQGMGAVLGAGGSVIGATKSAAGVLTDTVGLTNPNYSDYARYGNARGGYGFNNPATPSPWTPTTPTDISGGMTRRSDFTPSQNVNHTVKLEVTGNAEVLGALMDERAKAQFPVLLSNEIARQVVQAPKQ